VYLNVLAEIIAGSLLPGNPVANMVFKAYSVQTLLQALWFLQDLKLGHYMKIPPRATFLGALWHFYIQSAAAHWFPIVQLIAIVLVTFIQIGVKQWMFANVKDICSPTQSDFLTCPANQVWFTASAIWYVVQRRFSTIADETGGDRRGLIGPSRQFGTGTMYHPQVYAFIIGTFLPLPFWLWRRRYPRSWVRWVSMPLILVSMSYIPPGMGINYSSSVLVGFIFQYLIRKRNFAWWSKFNYVTGAALDSGTMISVLFIFFTLQIPKGGTIAVDWWGNNVITKSASCLASQTRTSTDLWLISGGLVWAGVKVDSAWWDSREFLEQESRLHNVSQVFMYLAHICTGRYLFSTPFLFAWG
jgi:hypothetical protein